MTWPPPAVSRWIRRLLDHLFPPTETPTVNPSTLQDLYDAATSDDTTVTADNSNISADQAKLSADQSTLGTDTTADTGAWSTVAQTVQQLSPSGFAVAVNADGSFTVLQTADGKTLTKTPAIGLNTPLPSQP